MSSISDTKRREVARKLREIEWRTMPVLTDGELLDLLAEAAGLDRYEGEHFEGGLLYCLADLIDRPTCENAADPYDGGLFVCSKCGERWELTCGNLADNHLCFCPRCGAEVVE